MSRFVVPLWFVFSCFDFKWTTIHRSRICNVGEASQPNGALNAYLYLTTLILKFLFCCSGSIMNLETEPNKNVHSILLGWSKPPLLLTCYTSFIATVNIGWKVCPANVELPEQLSVNFWLVLLTMVWAMRHFNAIHVENYSPKSLSC